MDQQAPAATLRIRLFGGLDLRHGKASLPPLDSARAESLLAYLLLHRDAPQPRRRLAFLLWPDSTERQALTNLRHVLHNLRRALPQADRFIAATQRSLHWRPDAPVWLDVTARRRHEIATIVSRMPVGQRGGLVASLRSFAQAGGEPFAEADVHPLVGIDQTRLLRQAAGGRSETPRTVGHADHLADAVSGVSGARALGRNQEGNPRTSWRGPVMCNSPARTASSMVAKPSQ